MFAYFLDTLYILQHEIHAMDTQNIIFFSPIYPSIKFLEFHFQIKVGILILTSVYSACAGLCTAYAVKTRKCPGGFNDTRHIAFTNYTAIIIWLAFVPLYLASTSNSIRVVTLAISLSLRY
jgi:amino acid permease